jgi:hypothetical protein
VAGLKPTLILNTVRGAEAPLFHAATDGRDVFQQTASGFLVLIFCRDWEVSNPQHRANSQKGFEKPQAGMGFFDYEIAPPCKAITSLRMTPAWNSAIKKMAGSILNRPGLQTPFLRDQGECHYIYVGVVR